MTSSELLINLLEDARLQLEKSLEGLPADLERAKLAQKAMSPFETAEHVSEVYVAFLALTEGRKHEWGNFHSRSDDFTDRISEMLELRRRLIDRVLQNADSQIGELGVGIALHDQYHVGQLSQLRACMDPNWDWRVLYSHYDLDI